MSPPMPVFPVSPERAAGIKSPHASAASPTFPDLRTSPLRKHRRNDSDVSVQGLAAMFENLEVKDFKELQAKYMRALQTVKVKHTSEMQTLEKKQAIDLGRWKMRTEEAEDELEKLKELHKACISREDWDLARRKHREEINKWETAAKRFEEHKANLAAKLVTASETVEACKAKCYMYRKAMEDGKRDANSISSHVSVLKGRNSQLEKTIVRLESDVKQYSGEAKKYREEADKYKNDSYLLGARVEAAEARLTEEIQALTEKLKLVEGERDTLKTNLKEEEVLRIAAEGRIPLPASTTDEHDEFGSPVRSPRKQRTAAPGEEDKENVAPKKAVVELKLAQQELTTERRLRERAQEQIEFMKMECQFRCCSCRIADTKGSRYVYDNTYIPEMELIKASLPVFTPPPSDHGEELMEGVITQEFMDDARALTPPADDSRSEHQTMETGDQSLDTTIIIKPSASITLEPAITFSPTTGTFRATASPGPTEALGDKDTLANRQSLARANTRANRASSPWAPDAQCTIIPLSRPQSRIDVQPIDQTTKQADIAIHEDAVSESDENDVEPKRPLYEPADPATPGPYMTRTITTTTTIPMHFSPITPAARAPHHPITPSTVAHAPMDARTPALGELSLNNLPFDREAALEAIRQRRGRARSMAAGHGTPHKQMMDGVKERRDISAPVSRLQR